MIILSIKPNCDILPTFISGNFELLEDYLDPDPLRFTITKIGNIHERQYDSEIGQDSGRFTFRDHGKFNICIENGVSRASDGKLRKVGFSIRVKPVYDDHDDSPGPMTEAVSRLDDLCDEVLDNLDHLLDKIELYKERERLHRDVSEKTFKNVWKWSFIEKFILMLVSISQVFYLKSYFSKSRGF
jgi:hypothetical protein